MLEPEDWKHLQKDLRESRSFDLEEKELKWFLHKIPHSCFEERVNKIMGDDTYRFSMIGDLEELEIVVKAIKAQFDHLFDIVHRKGGLSTHKEGHYLAISLKSLIQMMGYKCKEDGFGRKKTLFFLIKDNMVDRFEKVFQPVYDLLIMKEDSNQSFTKWEKNVLLRSFMLQLLEPINEIQNFDPTKYFCAIFENYLEEYEKREFSKYRMDEKGKVVDKPACFGYFDENNKECCAYGLGGECKKEWETKDPYKFYIDADIKLLKVFLLVVDNRKKFLPVLGKIDITPNLTDEERFNCPQSENKWAIEFIEKRYRFFEEKGKIIMENRIHLTRQELGWNEVK